VTALPISRGLTGDALIEAINDRLRRIAPAATPAASSQLSAFSGQPGGLPAPDQIYYGTHAERARRPASEYPDTALYREIDRTALYQMSGAGQTAGSWTYVAGVMWGAAADKPADLGVYDAGFLFGELVGTAYLVRRWTGSAWVLVEAGGRYKRTQSQLAALAATLGADQAGLEVEVTDYAHILRWTGTVWERSPSDPEHSDTFHMAGAAITETGWHACDGASRGVSYLKYDGSLGTRDLPNLAATPAMPKLGSTYSATVAAAVAPALTMNSYTPLGTVAAPSLTMNSYTPAGTVAAPGITVDSKTLTTANFVTTGGATPGVTEVAHSHTGSATAPAFTGTAAVLTGSCGAPAFTGTAAVLTGSVSLAGGDPVAAVQMVCCYRQ